MESSGLPHTVTARDHAATYLILRHVFHLLLAIGLFAYFTDDPA